MTCEIYDDLRSSSLLISSDPDCRYEEGCPKTCDTCIFKQIFEDFEEISQVVLDTKEDLKQDADLPKLAAERRKNSPTFYDILEDVEIKTETSLLRRN